MASRSLKKHAQQLRIAVWSVQALQSVISFEGYFLTISFRTWVFENVEEEYRGYSQTTHTE
jgi:hypothetical protein